MSIKDKEEEFKNKFKKVNRGTTDELEILCMIIANHPGLKVTVMEKIKQAKRRTAVRTSGGIVKDAG